MIRVALDAMGGDGAPGPEVDGAVLALRELPADFELTLVGREPDIEAQLARHPAVDRSRLRIVAAPDVIGMAERPLAAVRKKPNSSLVVGLNLHRTAVCPGIAQGCPKALGAHRKEDKEESDGQEWNVFKTCSPTEHDRSAPPQRQAHK